MSGPSPNFTIEHYNQRLSESPPLWVQKLLLKVARVFLSTIKEAELQLIFEYVRVDFLNAFSKLPAHIQGAILGHCCASAVALRQFKDRTGVKPASLMDQMIASKEEQFSELAAPILKQFLRLPMKEATAAVNSFSKAFSHTVLENGQLHGGGNNWRADLCMLFWWPFVEQLESIADLHRFLQNEVGVERAGELKRLEALCRSIGLRYRARGKPSRNS